MDQLNENEKGIGFWLGGAVVCPLCFEGQHAPHEGIIPSDDLVGLVTHCRLCGIQLWAYQAWKKEIEDSQTFPMKNLKSKRGKRDCQISFMGQ